jgi:hypothetical protein
VSDGSWLERIKSELKAPVEVSPDFDRRIAAALRAGPGRYRSRRAAAIGSLVVAASIACLGLLGSRSAARKAGPGLAHPGGTEVEFAIDVPAARTVALVGDFNDWDRVRTPLRRVEGSPRWWTRLTLVGGSYHYAFLVDGVRWIADPRQPTAVDPDFGGVVSLVAVE